MLSAYLNYPNRRVSVHGNRRCGFIPRVHQPGQRRIQLAPRTLGSQLRRFIEGMHPFASHAKRNDMWVYIDFSGDPFEEQLVHYIHRLLGGRYKRFRDAPFERHC